MRSNDAVAVLGAGPYGLAAAAFLNASGVPVRVFGEPMSFWKTQMPAGMLLRSSWDASHIASPHARLSLDVYQRREKREIKRPIPLNDFVEYGSWFQRSAVANLDRRRIMELERAGGGFRLLLDDGDHYDSERVVVAAGIAPFASRPGVFQNLPAELASHSSAHSSLAQFAGKRVIVIGAGQSALESAALLHEAGAEVEVLVRQPQVIWLRRYTGFLSRLPFVKQLLYPSSDIGPPLLNQIVHRPALYKMFSPRLQSRIAYRSIRPAGSAWLMPRLTKVRITTGVEVRSAAARGDAVQLKLSDGSMRIVNHVLMATGYKVDIAHYGFLSPRLLADVAQHNGYPQLSRGFESSMPGLYFVGAPAAHSFGPLMRFVAGTPYAAPRVAHSIAAALRTSRRIEMPQWPTVAQSPR